MYVRRTSVCNLQGVELIRVADTRAIVVFIIELQDLLRHTPPPPPQMHTSSSHLEPPPRALVTWRPDAGLSRSQCCGMSRVSYQFRCRWEASTMEWKVMHSLLYWNATISLHQLSYCQPPNAPSPTRYSSSIVSSLMPVRSLNLPKSSKAPSAITLPSSRPAPRPQTQNCPPSSSHSPNRCPPQPRRPRLS